MKKPKPSLEQILASPPPLRPYQVEGRDYLAKRTMALLADSPGLGKSAQALTALPPNAPVLIICPSIATGVWAGEVGGMWRPDGSWFPGWREEFTVQHLKGKANFRWPERGEILTCTYDSLPPEPGLHPLPGTVVILDEAHLIKGGDNQRCRATRAICKVARFSGGRSWGLTGTPLLSRGSETWNILEILGLEKKAWGKKGNFVVAFGGRTVAKEFWRGRRREVRYLYEWDGPITPEAKAGLERVYLRRRKEDVLKDLPWEKTYDDVLLPLNLVAKKACHELEVAIAQTGRSMAELIEIIEAGKLKAIIDIGEIAKTRVALAMAKVPFMMEYVEMAEDCEEPLVVFSDHRGPIEALAERPGWEVIHGGVSHNQRTKIVERFQAGLLKGLGATIRSAGVAITLTRSSHCVFLDKNWVPAINRQSEDRLARLGQAKNVQVTSLIFDHPMEMHLHTLLQQKMYLENKVLGGA